MSHMKNWILCSYILIIALFISIQKSFSQISYELESSKSLAVGNAIVATAEDDDALFGNPAGLVAFDGIKTSIHASYQNYSWKSLNIKQNYSQLGGAVAVIYNNWGLLFGRWQKGDKMNEWTVVKNNSVYLQNAKFLYYEQFINLCYSFKVAPGLAVGLRGRYLASDVHDSYKDHFTGEYKGVVVDVGILWKYSEALKIGLNIDYLLSSKFKHFIFSDLGQPVIAKTHPVSLNIGMQYKPMSKLLLSTQVKNVFTRKIEIEPLYENENIELRRSYHLGAEYWLFPCVALRTGFIQQSYPIDFSVSDIKEFNYMSRKTYSFGIGFALYSFILDIAISHDNRKDYLKLAGIEDSLNRYLLSLAFVY